MNENTCRIVFVSNCSRVMRKFCVLTVSAARAHRVSVCQFPDLLSCQSLHTFLLIQQVSIQYEL